MSAFYWSLVLVGIGMSAVGGLLLKIGAVEMQYDGRALDIALQLMLNWKIILGVFMYFIPVLIWIFLLKRIELSFLQPLFSMVYVITPILASIFLNENVTRARSVGIGAIIVGVILVARS
jgi:drug/metabolite transporter (DMT)-like permease